MTSSKNYTFTDEDLYYLIQSPPFYFEDEEWFKESKMTFQEEKEALEKAYRAHGKADKLPLSEAAINAIKLMKVMAKYPYYANLSEYWTTEQRLQSVREFEKTVDAGSPALRARMRMSFPERLTCYEILGIPDNYSKDHLRLGGFEWSEDTLKRDAKRLHKIIMESKTNVKSLWIPPNGERPTTEGRDAFLFDLWEKIRFYALSS